MDIQKKNNCKVVVTGGPGSGKTWVINFLAKKNFCCFEEISREIIRPGRLKGIENYFSEKPLEFSDILLKKRKKQYMESSNLSLIKNKSVIFFDRGLHDIFAYLNYVKKSYDSMNIKLEKYSYDIAFILPPWKEIYKTDSERKETYEQSIEIYRCIKKIYEEYKIPLYEIKPDTVENRVIEIFKYLKLNHFINF